MKQKKILGSIECCTLPQLSLPLIKAKVDTGAKTSALYAVNIEKFSRDQQEWVRFAVLPLQKTKQLKIQCEAPILTERKIKNSGGTTETRIVIKTQLHLGSHPADSLTKILKKEIELTLSSKRDSLSYRMLLGREALAGFLIDPTKLYCQGRAPKKKSLH